MTGLLVLDLPCPRLHWWGGLQKTDVKAQNFTTQDESSARVFAPLGGRTDEENRVRPAPEVDSIVSDVHSVCEPVGWRPRRAPRRREELGKDPVAHRDGRRDCRGALGLPFCGEHGDPTWGGTRGDDVEEHEGPARHRTRRASGAHGPRVDPASEGVHCVARRCPRGVHQAGDIRGDRGVVLQRAGAVT